LASTRRAVLDRSLVANQGAQAGHVLVVDCLVVVPGLLFGQISLLHIAPELEGAGQLANPKRDNALGQGIVKPPIGLFHPGIPISGIPISGIPISGNRFAFDPRGAGDHVLLQDCDGTSPSGSSTTTSRPSAATRRSTPRTPIITE
jgi:hypothetical protein